MRSELGFVLALSWAASASATTISVVTVGNPGNPADTRYIDSAHPSGVGSVTQLFNIGKTEITNSQYVEFLNAVATADPYGLYNPLMDSYRWGGIVRSGTPGTYTYAVQAPERNGTYTFDNRPVLYVNSGDAMRFANWLHNGQPTGAEDVTTTEDGAYTLNGATTSTSLQSVARNATARWWIPSEDEWYKAAYHKNDGVTGNYWDFPTRTDSVPDNNPPSSDSGNSVNYYVDGYTTGDGQLPLTDAGAYTLSGSPYGTFDQAGNVWEWTDTVFDDSFRRIRGGCWGGGDGSLRPSDSVSVDPTYEEFSIGFRVASAVPEPSTLLLFGIGAVRLVGYRKRTR